MPLRVVANPTLGLFAASTCNHPQPRRNPIEFKGWHRPSQMYGESADVDGGSPDGRMGYHLSVFEEAIGVGRCCTRASQGEQRRSAARISSAEGTTSSCEESSAQGGTRLPAEVMSSSSIRSDTYGPYLMRAVLPIFSASAAPAESRHPVEQLHASIQRVWDLNRPRNASARRLTLVRNQSNRGPLRQVSSARSLAPRPRVHEVRASTLRPRSWFPLPTRSILSQNEPPEL